MLQTMVFALKSYRALQFLSFPRGGDDLRLVEESRTSGSSFRTWKRWEPGQRGDDRYTLKGTTIILIFLRVT